MHAVPLGSVLDVAFWISRMLTWLQVAFRCWGKRTSTVNITNDTAAMSHLQTREVNCNVFCRTICSWLKWTRKWKLYSEKSVIQIKASNSKLSTMRAQFSVWVSVCVLHSYSYSVIFTPVKESKTCMTNFLPYSWCFLLWTPLMQPASGISNMLVTWLLQEMHCLFFWD